MEQIHPFDVLSLLLQEIAEDWQAAQKLQRLSAARPERPALCQSLKDSKRF
jgi:hypothetical protein